MSIVSYWISVMFVGPNGLSGEFLFQLRYIIVYPLWILFRRSLDKGIFPSMLKFSSVTPCSKITNSSIAANYRSISFQSHIANIFDSLFLYGIQCSANNILMKKQHGFRPGHSTSTLNLMFSIFFFFKSFLYLIKMTKAV